MESVECRGLGVQEFRGLVQGMKKSGTNCAALLVEDCNCNIGLQLLDLLSHGVVLYSIAEEFLDGSSA